MGHGKVFKQQRNIAEEKKKESVARQELFMKDIQESSRKHKCDLVAALQYKNTAIIPTIVVVDVKEKYEHMTEEAKKAEETKKSSNLNSQAPNGDLEKPGVPKLEV